MIEDTLAFNIFETTDSLHDVNFQILVPQKDFKGLKSFNDVIFQT